MSQRITISAILLVIAAAIYQGQGPAKAPLPNILLITIDTLRADHLSCYGYHLETSPAIDRLAAEGVRFDRAYSVIPLTGPSHLSLFTSRFPQEHGARINGVAVPEESKWLFLPQILRKLGYVNVAYVSAWPLTAHLTRLDRWFDVYDEKLTRTYQVFNSSRYAQDVNPRVISWLDNNKHEKPFFMWVHYFDPHSPYLWREAYGAPKPSGHRSPAMEWRGSSIRKRIEKYDSEIGYTDHYVGQLLEKIDEQGLRDSTLVVLTSDHGESLGEHGYVGHGRQLYEGILRVPLIMRYPGRIAKGMVINENVSLLDVTPTTLGLATGKEPDVARTFAGLNLLPALQRGEKMPKRPVHSVTFAGKKGWAPGFLSWMWVGRKDLPLRVGKVDGSMKWVWSPRDNLLSIVDTDRDPLELNPRVLKYKNPQYEEAATELKLWFDKTDLTNAEMQATQRDQDILETLGYTQ